MASFHHRAARSLRHLAHAAPAIPTGYHPVQRRVRSPLEGFVYAVPIGLLMWAVIGGTIAIL